MTKDGSVSGNTSRKIVVDVAGFETEDSNEIGHSPETTAATYDEWIKENMIPALGLCSNGSFSDVVSRSGASHS